MICNNKRKQKLAKKDHKRKILRSIVSAWNLIFGNLTSNSVKTQNYQYQSISTLAYEKNDNYQQLILLIIIKI